MLISLILFCLFFFIWDTKKQRLDERNVEYRNITILGKKCQEEKKKQRRKKMEELKAAFELNVKELFLWKLDYKCILTSFYLPHREVCLLAAFSFVSTVHCCKIAITQLWTSCYYLSLIWKWTSKDTDYTHLPAHMQGSMNFCVV